MQSLSIKEIKERMKTWGGKVTSRLETEDPRTYGAEATVTLYGVTHTSWGNGETRTEAINEALQSLAYKAF